jgi:hypothetical protein
MELFDVHVLGFEVSEERATRSLMQVFGLSEAAARIFVHSVPRIGKRRVPKETAERYIRALHAVGAMVECRIATPSAADATPTAASLPAPAVSNFPGVRPHIMQDSFGVMAPVQYSPHMPEIPKAPRIPADLHAIRARKGPDSLAPHWRPTDGPDPRRGSSPRAPFPSDSDLQSPNPDALVISSSGDKPASPVAVAMGDPALGPAIAARAADGAIFDNDGRLSSPKPSPPPPDPDSPWYAQPTYQLILACGIIGTMTIAASSGMFETNASRLGREFERAGVEAGEYERAIKFLSASDSRFEGLPKDEARKLLDDLLAAGAVDAWVIGIAPKAGVRSSHVLLVELPEDAGKRKKVFDAHAQRAKSTQGPSSDRGQRFLSLTF